MNGVSVNAFTTVGAQKKGANDLSVEFLESYTVPDKIIPLIKMQLTKLFHHFNEGNPTNEEAFKLLLNTLEKKLKNRKFRFGLVDIDCEIYELR
jgi:hypothetical protein